MTEIPVSPEIPPELIDLGVILGLVTNGQGPLQLNTEWFRDPITNLKGALTEEDRRTALITRATALFGTVSDELDIPTLHTDETWIPIADTSNGAVTGGLFAIIDVRGDDPVIALGAQIAVERDGVDASVTVRVPLVAASPPADGVPGVDLLLGTDRGVIEAAATIEVADLGVPGVVELDGVCLSALLPTNGAEPILTVVAKNLLMPGDQVPADVALGELLGDLGPTAVQVFVALLSSQPALPPAVSDLLALVGFDDTGQIPPLPLVDIVESGVPALRAWVADVVDTARDAWLTRLGSFLGGDSPIAPQGSGTATDPYRVCVATDDGAHIEACLTFVVETDAATATTTLEPGAAVRVEGEAADTLPGFVDGSVSFGRVLLDRGFTVTTGPTLRAVAQLGDGDLIDTTVDTTPVQVGTLRGGLASTADGRLQAVIEARDVVVGGASYDVVDLTDADAVVEAATSGLTDVLLEALNLDAIPEAEALAILAGLAPPDGQTDWPSVSLGALFTDPLGAIGCYHAEVLSVDGRWQAVAEQIVLLLRSGPAVAVAVTGTGTAADPWTATLFDTTGSGGDVTGRVDLVAWSTATGDGPRLSLGLRTHPTLAVGDVDADLSYVGEVLRVELPAVDVCPAPVGLVWAPSHAVSLTLDEPVLQLAPVTVAADVLSLGVVLERGGALAPRAVLSGATVTIDGVDVDLPDLDLGLGDAGLPDLGDLPWPTLQQLVADWLASVGVDGLDQLAALVGWTRGSPPPVTLPQLPDLDLDAPELPPLDLHALLTTPFEAIGGWLGELFALDPTGTPAELPAVVTAIGRFADALAAGQTDLTLDGAGTYDDPWAIGLAGAPLELLVWLDPDGPNVGGVVGIVEHLVPDDLAAGTMPVADALGLLNRAAGLVGRLADGVDDATVLATGIATIREVLEGDGLVTAASQRPAGWTEIPLGPTAHLIEPSAVALPQAVIDDVPQQGRIFVSSAALPTTAWPDQDGATVVDLTAPGIRPESIDLSHVTAGTHWHVVLPTRADAVVPTEPGVSGIERLRTRLRRAVDHIHGIVGGDLALIAHSVAGQVARLVASDPAADTHVTHVVTVGTPHGGATFEFLDRPETAATLRTLQRLQRLLDQTTPPPADIAALIDLLATLSHALDPYVEEHEAAQPDAGGPLAFLPFPLDDFAVPTDYPDLDPGTSGHAIVGTVGAALDPAIVAFVRRVIEAAIALLPTGELITHLGVGLRARMVEPDPAPGALSIAAGARVDLHRFRVADGDAPRQIPFVAADLELRRTGGWLVGGPDPGLPAGVPRDPRARWLEAHLRADPTDLAAADVQIIVHDAAVFGTHHDRWIIDTSTLDLGQTLLPEVRILLGEIATGLGTLVVDTTVERLAALLVALGLGEIIDDRLGLVTDAVERFIIDPTGEIRIRLADARDDVRAAVARLVPVIFDTATHRLPLGDVATIVVDLLDDTVDCVSVELAALPVAERVALSGTARLCTDGSVSAELTAASTDAPGPLGATVVRVTAAAGPGSADVTVTIDSALDDGDLPRLLDPPLAVLPGPADPAALAAVAARTLAGDVGRRALEVIRAELDAGRRAALDTALDQVALLTSDGRIRTLGPLLTRPGEWLAAPDVLALPRVPDRPWVPCLSGDGLSRLLTAVNDLLELPARGDALTLPWGAAVTVAATGDGSGVHVVVAWDAPVTSGDVTVDGSLDLVVGCGLDVSATVRATVEIAGNGLDHARLHITAGQTVEITVAVQATGSSEIALTLAPSLRGIDTVDPAAAAQSLLALVLDAVATDPTVPTLGQAIGGIGDALNLRLAGSFDGDRLRQLAADPAAHLETLPVADTFDEVAALLGLIDIAIDAATLPGALTVTPASGITVAVRDPVQLCLTLDGYAPIDGIRVDAQLCVAPTATPALTLSVQAEVVDPDLLATAGISLFPHVAAYVGGTASVQPDPVDRVEAGLWIQPPDDATRDGLFVKQPFGAAATVVCRTTGASDSTDLDACVAAILRSWATPLAVDVLLAADAVQTFLDGPVAEGTTTIGALLDAASILRSDAGAWQLDPAAMDDVVNRALALAGEVIEAYAALAQREIAPFTLTPTVDDDAYGFTLGLGETLDLISAGDVRLSLTAPADADEPGGVTVTLFELNSGAPEFTPAITIANAGLRIDNPGGGKLVDLLAGLHALEVLVSFSLGVGDDHGALDVVFDTLTVPVGIAQGGNPVAAKILSQDQEQEQSGDAEELAPALSPRVELAVAPQPRFLVHLDAGEPPWWVPIKRAFGPFYVEQIGGDRELDSEGDVQTLIILLDGSVTLAGLTVAADDLSLIIPVATAADLTTWGLDLAALAVGYSDDTVTLAGGLRKDETTAGIEYVGMAQLDAVGYGLSAIGAYGEFSDPALPDTTYTSMFVFAALSAPLGGPPFFFVTGIGAGLGLNRELVLPADVVDVPGFPLVAAMDASSGFAEDPMGSLRDMSTSFPGRRGTFWLAAGVRFTSFVLLETVAVISVEIGDEVEVALLGVSHAALPDADAPIANIELALIASFSTAEGVLWVQAQLTDNSWLLSQDCRLTGGFAFVIWFNRGEFVFTVGGYHPRFDVPDYFPVVPRVGYNWTVDNALVIKGESYFALTSSAVMAGASFEASYTTSTVWASLTAGVDALVEWDPFFYDVSAEVRVSAGIDVRICVLVCARVKMTFSMGARVRVWGPELKGRADLELGPVDVTVKFGGNARDEIITITWGEFLTRFLVQDNPAGEAMSLTILRGLLTPDTGEQSETDDGSAARPWRVLPEFTVRFETRAASTAVDAVGTSSDADPSPLVPSTIDVAPVGLTNVSSVFEIGIVDDDGEAVTGLEVDQFVVSRLPDAPWHYVEREARAPAADYLNALTGVVMQSTLEVADDDIQVDLGMVTKSDEDHPLPFFPELRSRESDELIELSDDGAAFVDRAPIETGAVYQTTAGAVAGYSTASRATLTADRASPPRLAPLTEGMIDDVLPGVTKTTVPPPPPPVPPFRGTRPPIVMGILRGTASPTARAPEATTVRAAADVPRIAAPTLAAVRLPGDDFPRARLELGSTGLVTRQTPDPAVRAAGAADERAVTVAPRGHLPTTRAAARGREFRGGFRSSPRVAAALTTITAQVRGEGHTVAAGDVLILRMPNARFDDRPDRPTLAVRGDQVTRLVAFDRAGVPVFERSLRSGTVTIPTGADRIVVAGTGAARRDGDRSGLAGWHAQHLVHQVASHTYLAPGAILRCGAPRTRREGSPVTLANITAREATSGQTVITHLPTTTTVVVVGLSPTAPVADLDDAFASLTIGLDGARRATGRDGVTVPPTTVASGDQVFGVFAVAARDDARWVSVTIESDPRWRVVAVGGARARRGSVVDDLADRDPVSLFPTGPDPAGSSTVRFVQAPGDAGEPTAEEGPR
jgi:hypothetical protein